MLTGFVTRNVTCNANVTPNVTAKSAVSQICHVYVLHSYIIILYRDINNRDIKYILNTHRHFPALFRPNPRARECNTVTSPKGRRQAVTRHEKSKGRKY